MKRGYRRKIIDYAIDRVKELRREAILDKVVREDKNNNRVRAVLRYDRRLPDVSAILRKNWKTMVSDDIRLLKVFPGPPMVCFTRGFKNSREEVCQAKLPPIRLARPVEEGFKRCGRGNCRLCHWPSLATILGILVRAECVRCPWLLA